MRFRFFLTGLAVTVAGCSDPEFVGRPGLTLATQADLPPPTDADLVTPGRPYLIGPFDRLQVEVFGVPELSRAVQADSTGKITLPLAGTIDAAGLTPIEVAELVRDRLGKQYIRDPKVTVNLTETLSQLITISGEVTEPGQFPIQGNMTLMRAIARAKGLGEFARANHVVVFRRANNQDMAALYDVRAIEQGIYPDPALYANDVVIVGTSSARRIFKDALQGSALLSAPLIALLNK